MLAEIPSQCGPLVLAQRDQQQRGLRIQRRIFQGFRGLVVGGGLNLVFEFRARNDGRVDFGRTKIPAWTTPGPVQQVDVFSLAMELMELRDLVLVLQQSEVRAAVILVPAAGWERPELPQVRWRQVRQYPGFQKRQPGLAQSVRPGPQPGRVDWSLCWLG